MATPEELAAAGRREVAGPAGRLVALDLGATVLSWTPPGQADVLFLSRDALVGTGDEIHGGIPVCAPWFGQGRDDVEVPAPHGLVRWVPWRLIQQTDDSLVWELAAADVAHLAGAADYPRDLRFRTEARLGATLRLSFAVDSPTTEFVLDEAFHCYFAVSDVADVTVGGLEGEPFRDYTAEGAWAEPDATPLRVDNGPSRVYQRSGQLVITDATRTVALSATGVASTIIWNPGPGAGRIGLADDEWRRFVCVEVGNVQDRAVTVPAGGSHTMELEISVTPRA